MLAIPIIHLHVRETFPSQCLSLDLSEEWRCPLQPVFTAGYATYVQILTWFFDLLSMPCLFSVHGMPLAGKELGKDIMQWFGPSIAAGATKCVDTSIIAACMLTLLSDPPQIHRFGSRSRSMPRSFRQMYTRHHIRLPNLLAIELGRARDRRAHPYLASDSNISRDIKGVCFPSSFTCVRLTWMIKGVVYVTAIGWQAGVLCCHISSSDLR